MVSSKNKKRRRSQAFPVETVEEEVSTQVEEPPLDISEPSPAEPSEQLNATNGEQQVVVVVVEDTVDPERLEKEQTIWDAFREEYFEAIEQLPLSLHRAFSLIKELDMQTAERSPELLSTLQTYLQLREVMVQPIQGGDTASPVVQDTGTSPSPPQAPLEETPLEEPRRLLRRSSTRSPSKNGAKAPVMPSPTPRQREESSAPSVQAITPRQRSALLLTKIAQLSEELVRASNEKINVARYTNDIVNRHIKDLDRAIKEQETSISLGLRPGTHPASIILPELVIPKSRAAGVNHDAESDSDEDAVEDPIEEPPASEPMIDPAEEEKPVVKTPRTRKGRVKHARKKSDVENREGVEADSKADDSPESRSAKSSRTLKFTLPPMSAITSLKEEPALKPEPRYCYCHQVSYGEMIACDGLDCKLEWFHVGCVGLEKLPTTSSWYCPDCSKKTKRKKGR